MAGISDQPMRQICQHFGAGLTTTEMITSQKTLWHTEKSLLRFMQPKNQQIPHSVQILGSDPKLMAEAAQAVERQGAQIIDINMGCPARKVCKKLAGSALLEDPSLVNNILSAITKAVAIPVTLKIRTGISPTAKNALLIGKIAEDNGIALLTIHGRTRACRFNGSAEYDTIAEVVENLSIPVIANGDIVSVNDARNVLDYTKAAGIMIGRGIRGQPWLIKELTDNLQRRQMKPFSFSDKHNVMKLHLRLLHEFYGEHKGLQIARKHIGWYLERLNAPNQLKQTFNYFLLKVDQEQFIDELPSLISRGQVA